MPSRRTFLRGCLQLAAAVCVTRSASAVDKQHLSDQIDEALARATTFLQTKQSSDGAWRSEVYGPLKDGISLTSFIAATLSGELAKPAEQPLTRAIKYLANVVQPNGTMDDNREITYPVYAAAGAVIAFSRQPGNPDLGVRTAWLSFLRQHQLVEHLGWQESDDSFGGWSFAHHPPHADHGKTASPLAVPNLSATVMALDAFRAAGCSTDDPAIQKALTFIIRCQNWMDEPSHQDPRFDDGGFFFLHDDPTRNKAGEAGTDSQTHIRYVSYGSTTADGLRALLKCGLSSSHLRVRAAQHWLLQNFSATQHPGGYPTEREYLRPALYYYYAASAAEALRLSKSGGRSWSSALALELLSRQQADGAWRNPAVDVREDDPLVASPLAVRALLNCKSAIDKH